MRLDLIPSTARIVDLRTKRFLDHQEFSRAVVWRSNVLRGAGVDRDDIVAICHRDGPSLLVDLFAAWEIGAAALVISPSLTGFERNRIVGWVKPACWIGDAAVVGTPFLSPELPRDVPVLERLQPTLIPAGDARALILLTSGSTGLPKGVVLSHRALRARLHANVRHIGKPLALTLVPLPLHFGHGLIGNALSALIAGGTVLLWPEPGVDGLARLGTIIDEQDVSFLSSVPSMWRMVLKLSKPGAKGTLKRIHVGSEPLSGGLWKGICDWAGTRCVFNMYGMTEAANWIAGASAEDGFTDGAVGRPWSGDLRVLREDGSVAETGFGEVLLSDPALMSGYLNDPEITAAAFHGSWFRTGDIGEIDAGGRLRILGRSKHQINRAGIKVTAEEVELLIEQHPAVQEACAFGLPDPVSGEIVAAAIVLKDGSALSQPDLLSWCAERLRKEAVPSRIMLLPALPRNDRGKKVRSAVLDMVQGTRGWAA